MTEPLVTPDDLGVYFNEDSINYVRAASMIDDATILCQSIVSPLPDTAAVVVKRVAARAYATVTSPRQNQLASAGSPFGVVASGTGSVSLNAEDREDLLRLAAVSSGVSSSAFTVDMLPARYSLPTPPWGSGQ